MSKMPWLKLYAEIIHDPKIRRLSVDERWFWIVLLCLAAQNNKRGQVTLVTDTIPFTRDDYTELCGYTVHDQINGDLDPREMVDDALKKFVQLRMITIDANGIVEIINFEKRQDSHLSDAERASRYRSRTKVTTVTLDKEEEGDKDKKKKTTLSRKREGVVYPEGFLKFWNTYPKKKSKGQAERAWNNLRPDEQLLAKMVATIERAKTSVDWTKDGGQWVPFPATWLNGKRWEDEFTHGGSDGKPDKYAHIGE